MKKSHILLVALFAMVAHWAKAQDNVPLIVEGSWFDKSEATITWKPTDAQKWMDNLDKGYKVERFELEMPADTDFQNFEAYAENAKKGKAKKFPEKGGFVPADTMWFFQNRFLGGGYANVMGKMLHDTIFNLAADGGANHAEKHKYALFGMQFYSDQMGEGLGLGFKDTSVDTNKTYRYVVTSLSDAKVTASVDLSKKFLSQNESPGYISMNYDDVPFKSALPAPATNYEVRGLAKAFGDSIVLRWAPLTASSMKGSRHLGYRVIKSKRSIVGQEKLDPRYEIFTPKFEFTVMDTFVVKPWDSLTVTQYKANTPTPDSMVMVALQFFFGENALPDATAQERADQLESMYVYALYAAEQSGRAADALGLRLVDYDIEKDSSYIYRIELPLDSIDPQGNNLVSDINIANDYKGPPELFDVQIAELEFAISVGFHIDNDKNYSFYYFEKSEDSGNTWAPMHDKAMKFETDVRMENEIDYYALVDSVDVLYKTFKYRIRGVNAFGEYSPWAEVEGQAVDLTPPMAPVMNEPIQIDENTVEITWIGVPSETAPDHTGYVIMLGRKSEMLEAENISPLLPKGTTRFEYKRDTFSADSLYFFQVAAVDTAGNMGMKYPQLLSVMDSIPPAIPQGLIGKADTTGIVKIAWEPVPDKDVLGYRVYFSNTKEDLEYAQITKDIHKYNLYKDTIEVRTITEEIYYRVSAVDLRFNESEQSEILVVRRPDLIPPTLPVMKQPNVGREGVLLTWIESSSVDLTYYYLYRRSMEEPDSLGNLPDWILLDSLIAGTASFLDSTGTYEKMMEYSIIAKDDDENYSERTPAVEARRFFDEVIETVDSLSANYIKEEKSIQLKWQYQKPNNPFFDKLPFRYTIHKGKGDEPLNRYKQLVKPDKIYFDENVKPGVSYRYAMSVVFKDGKTSEISDEIIIQIPKPKPKETGDGKE